MRRSLVRVGDVAASRACPTALPSRPATAVPHHGPAPMTSEVARVWAERFGLATAQLFERDEAARGIAL